MHQVGDEITNLLRGKRLEKTFRHDGLFESDGFLEGGFFEGGFVSESAEGDRFFGGTGDDSR